MSRPDRQSRPTTPRDAPARASAPSQEPAAPPPAAEPPAPPPSRLAAEVHPLAVPESPGVLTSVDAFDVAPSLADLTPEATLVEVVVAPPAPCFVALRRISAGVAYEAGDEIPAWLAGQLTEGDEYETR